jgi:hypothetical protein
MKKETRRETPGILVVEIQYINCRVETERYIVREKVRWRRDSFE